MEKIKKQIPTKISLIGHQVVLPEKQFNLLVETIDSQTNTINTLIDAVSEISSHLDSSDANVQKLQNSIQALANAFKTYTEE